MKHPRTFVPLAATAALVLASGCGTVGEFFLGTIRKSVVQTVRTSTSQAVEQTTLMLELAVQQAATQVVQSATSQAVGVIQDGFRQVLDPRTISDAP
jgi:hypothetical protein